MNLKRTDMSILKKSALTVAKEWVLVTLGILIYVGGWSLFLIPNNLVGGGVSGISSMVQYATQGAIQMGYTYFVINAILVVLAILILGMGFGAKTIYAIILASVALRFLPGLIPPEIINTLSLQNGKLMSVLMGGLMAGLGIGMSISNGGSTGGTDIIALIYTKYHNVSPGKVILFLDFIIIVSSLVFPSYVHDVDPETGLLPLGDMAISYEKAAAQAEEFGHTVKRELGYLTIHSILHLLGYDHVDEGPMKKQMRAREEAICAAIDLER